MRRSKTIGLFIAAALVLTCFLGLSNAIAEEYKIGPEDILDIRFWQDQTLNAEVRVSLDGKISLDIIGSITATGKTTDQLQNDIVRLISRLNKNISQATVRVIAHNYQYVFVIGQVMVPGKVSFEEIPDLWTIINEVGGITEFGDLSRVTIIRGGGQAGKIEVVNVSQAISEGRQDRLPKIGRLDTIEIPRTAGLMPGTEVTQTTQVRNLIYIIGAVVAPGPITFQENLDIMEALALAGGPTDNADLKKVQLVIKDGNFAQAIMLDLDKYTRTGKPQRYMMQREDLFYVPPRRDGFFSGGLGNVAAALGMVSTIVLIADRIK